MKTKTLTFSGSGTFEKALEYFKATLPAFTVERTGYTAKLIDHEDQRYLFAEDEVKPRLFPIAKRLKEEVTANGVPEVDEASIRYFGFRRAKQLDNLPAVAHCVDLSSAYAYALLHRKLISPETLDALCKLPKGDRLRVIGMLATTKTVFTYERGTVTKVEVRHSPTRAAFFGACETVGRIMEQVTDHPAHLFYWVDGAYFDRPVPEVSEYFTGQGFPCKEETVTNLRWSKSRRILFYEKDGTRKYLGVPGDRKPSPKWIETLLNT